MTILDMLSSMHKDNKLITEALEIIKDNFISIVNNNYELTINEEGELTVKIPSLEKRDEYVYKSIDEYEYTLIMCMRIIESDNPQKYNYMLGKFMELYKDKLELFFKDVSTVHSLKNRIVKKKESIDNITYASIGVMIIGGLTLCISQSISQTVRSVITAAIVLFPLVSLAMQFTKEGQVKTIIDGYISLIKTEWYVKELKKQYVFLCNFIE